MGQIVFVIFILCIFIYYPQTIIVTGLLLAGFYFYGKYEVVERDPRPGEEEDNELDSIDPAAIAEKELESKMKKGYQDDPEWQKLSKKVNNQSIIMRQVADLDMKVDELEEERARKPGPEVDFDLAEAQKQLKMLKNLAGITQKRRERAKEEKITPPTLHPEPRELTDQEIDAALHQLNDE